jgi:hypothetical protein
LDGTDATGNIACPAYPALGGSGTVIEVAAAVATGVITLVAVNAGLVGKCGALGAAGADNPDEPLSHAASNAVSVSVPIKVTGRIVTVCLPFDLRMSIRCAMTVRTSARRRKKPITIVRSS